MRRAATSRWPSATPERVQKRGKAAKARVTVHNRAGQDVESYSFALIADGKEIAARTVSEPLAAFTMRSFDIDIPVSAVNDNAKVDVKATVSCDNDADSKEQHGSVDIRHLRLQRTRSERSRHGVERRREQSIVDGTQD